MTPPLFLTPALVRRYLDVLEAPSEAREMLDGGMDVEDVLDSLPGAYHEAHVGVLASAERLRDSRRKGFVGQGYDDAIDTGIKALITMAGVDPGAWEATR